MRTFHKACLPRSASRREAVGLMGAFLIFLVGLPSHAESMVDSAKHLVQQMVRLILVFLGLATPTAQPNVPIPLPSPAPAAVVHAKPPRTAVTVKPVKIDPDSMFLRNEPVLHRFTYIFEGKASLHNEPCPNASVLVRLISGDRTVTQGTITDSDGAYSLKIAIDAQDMAPVDWTMEAYTSEFKKVELAGRRIVQKEEEPDQQPITVTTPVQFTVSSAK